MAVCDICGKQHPISRMNYATADAMKSATKNGFVPETLAPQLLKHATDWELQRFAITEPGNSVDFLETPDFESRKRVLWALAVSINESDWAICNRCHRELSEKGFSGFVHRRARDTDESELTQIAFAVLGLCIWAIVIGGIGYVV